MRGKVHRENMRKNGSARLAREEDYRLRSGNGTARCHDRAGIDELGSDLHIREKSERSDRIVFESR